MRKPYRPKRKSGRRRSGPSVRREILELTIDHVGGRGDGVAHDGDRLIYVPYTLPGERVRATTCGKQGDGLAAKLDEVIIPSAQRVDPVCSHFGTCGGCQLQHMAVADYGPWMRNQVVTALSRRGFDDVPIDDGVLVAPGTRRRMSLAVSGGKIGYAIKGSHTLVPIDLCPLLAAGLNDLIAPLTSLVSALGNVRQIQATLLAAGPDIIITGPKSLDLAAREALAAFADAENVARLSWRADADDFVETVSERVQPFALFGDVRVGFPAGAFLQPSVEGEAALVGPVRDWLRSSSRIVDLFCGLGTFTFPLAGHAVVHGIDGADDLVNALATSAGRAGLGGKVSAECRDLFARPLDEKDLSVFDGAVFDPPRAGAKEQAALLARAQNVVRVAAVSCNPATFARDMRTLVDGGFTLERVILVDQFPYSPHGEVVGLLAR